MNVNIWDRFLVTNFLSHRNEASFVKLYKRYAPSLFQLSHKLSGGNLKLTEGVILNTWVAVTENLASYSFRTPIKSWLMETVIHCSREQYRKNLHYMLLNESTGVGRPQHRSQGDILLKSSTLSSLSVGYRHVYVLHDLYEYKHSEISELLKISEGASKSFLQNAYKYFGLTASAATRCPHSTLFGGRFAYSPAHLRFNYQPMELPKYWIKTVKEQLLNKGLINKNDCQCSSPYAGNRNALIREQQLLGRARKNWASEFSHFWDVFLPSVLIHKQKLSANVPNDVNNSSSNRTSALHGV